MSHDEFKELSRRFWEEDFNYLYIDRSKMKNGARYCICIESKNTYIEYTLFQTSGVKTLDFQSNECYSI